MTIRAKASLLGGLLFSALAAFACTPPKQQGTAEKAESPATAAPAGTTAPAAPKNIARPDRSLKGQKVAFVPIAMGFPITESWNYVLKQQAEALGVTYILRDPNWNPQAQVQAITSLISEKVDLIVVQNPSLELLATQLEQAEKAGIYVVQINMESNYKTDFFVGIDSHEIGRKNAEAVVRLCGAGSGKSGKVLILQGEATASGSVWQLEGAMEVYKKHPEINIVASQPTGWQANEASRIATTVLQQHKDLCAVHSFWDVLANSAAQAIKEAGLKGQVKNVTSGDGSRFACDLIEKGEIDDYLSYNSMLQGHEIMAVVRALLRTGQPPGSYRLASYSFLEEISPSNMRREMCWDMPKK